MVRQVGVVAQALLQIMIILTGNYNFFNFLTLALLVPVWAADPNITPVPVSAAPIENEAKTAKSSFWKTVAAMSFIVNVIAVLGALMFRVQYLPPAEGNGVDVAHTILSHLNSLQLQVSPNVELYLPIVVRYAGVVAAGN